MLIGTGIVLSTALTACTRITHVPQCPNVVDVGSTVNITATVSEPGAVPRYLWEAIPEGAGTFGDPRSVSTTFSPAISGPITLRLSAADGLFLFVDECVINEGTTASGVEVSLLVNPTNADVGIGVLFTCTSTGTTPAIDFSITQTGGAAVEIIDILPGVASFDADTPGTFTFQCVGEGPGGELSLPVSGTVVVTNPDDDGGRLPGGR